MEYMLVSDDAKDLIAHRLGRPVSYVREMLDLADNANCIVVIAIDHDTGRWATHPIDKKRFELDKFKG